MVVLLNVKKVKKISLLEFVLSIRIEIIMKTTAKWYCLKNSAEMYLERFDNETRPFTTDFLNYARFWTSEKIAQSMIEVTNRDWNTDFRLIIIEVTEIN